MRKFILPIVINLVGVLLFGSCIKVFNRCRPETDKFFIHSTSVLDTVRYANSPDTIFRYYSLQIKPGGKLVFQYEHQNRDCPEIADDEGSRDLYFETDAAIDHFLIKDSAALFAAKTFVALSCFCYPTGPVAVKAGSIEGTRIATNKWRVKLDLTMPWNQQSKIQLEQEYTVR